MRPQAEHAGVTLPRRENSLDRRREHRRLSGHAETPAPSVPLRIEHTVRDGSSVVRSTGSLTTTTYPLLRDGLLKYAAETPEAVVIDIGDLRIDQSALLSVFSLVWMRVADWPGVPVMLVVADETRRSRLARQPVARYVPVHADTASALASLPPRQRYRKHAALAGAETASKQARVLAREVCDQWELDDLLEDAQLIATELVENALTHTNAAPALRFELRRGILSIAVTDDSPTRPAVTAAEPERDSGRGLHLLATLARTWGANPTLAGGKVVWAVLPTRTRR